MAPSAATAAVVALFFNTGCAGNGPTRTLDTGRRIAVLSLQQRDLDAKEVCYGALNRRPDFQTWCSRLTGRTLAVEYDAVGSGELALEIDAVGRVFQREAEAGGISRVLVVARRRSQVIGRCIFWRDGVMWKRGPEF